jgi:hypothetical protein
VVEGADLDWHQLALAVVTGSLNRIAAPAARKQCRHRHAERGLDPVGRDLDLDRGLVDRPRVFVALELDVDRDR